jgi:hypothetical protein
VDHPLRVVARGPRRARRRPVHRAPGRDPRNVGE